MRTSSSPITLTLTLFVPVLLPPSPARPSEGHGLLRPHFQAHLRAVCWWLFSSAALVSPEFSSPLRRYVRDDYR